MTAPSFGAAPMPNRQTDVPCGATTTVPIYAVTAICELPHGHDGAHHGHINEGPTLADAGSYHAMGPESHDWTFSDGRFTEPLDA